MKIILCALLALSLSPIAVAAPAQPAVTAKSQIDERGIVALDRAVEYYSGQRSFSVSGRETLKLNEMIMRRTAFEFAAQSSERASLKVNLLAADGATDELITAHLLNATSYTVQEKDQPAQVSPVTSARERDAAFADLIRALPALGLSVGAFVMNTNPARTQLTSSVSFALGENNTEIVTTRNQVAGDPTTVNAQYTLDATSGALKSLVTRITLNDDQIVTTSTEFEAPRSNWQGSQSATDGAVYTWERLAATIAAERAAEQSRVSVDPEARAVFERAVNFYRSLDALRLVWEQTKIIGSEKETTRGRFDYERAGRLRLQFPSTLSSLIVVDGNSRWTLESKFLNPDGPLRYRQTVIDESERIDPVFIAFNTSFGLPATLKDLLNNFGFYPLNPRVISAVEAGRDFISFESQMLEPQLWNGEMCDLVQTLEINRNAEAPPQRDLHQIVYWFARSDGRLMRVQEGTRIGDGTGITTDSQILEQNINPNFAPDTFKFVPPDGAVLRK